jgi:CRP-like cAMP-binding protein
VLDRVRHVSTLERLHCLLTFPLFSSLPPEQLISIAQAAREVLFRRGERIVTAGTRIERVYFVVEGRVRCSLDRADKLEAGEPIGLVELLARSAHGSNVEAETETLALELEADALLDVMEDEFSLCHSVVRALCNRVLEIGASPGCFRLSTEPGPRSPARRSAPLREPALPREPRPELDLAERMIVLRRALAFTRKDIASLAQIASDAREIHLDANEVLGPGCEPDGDVVVVLAGALETLSERGESVAALGPLDVTGLLEGLAGRAHRLRARATAPATLLCIEGGTLVDVLEDDFEMTLELVALVARELLAAGTRRARLVGAAHADPR